MKLLYSPKRSGNVEVPPVHTPARKIARAGQDRGEIQEEEAAEKEESHSVPEACNQQQKEEAKCRALAASWESSKFRLRPLKGHSDMITCVVVVDNLVISGSRDTTVKVWHVPTATEQRNLGGHSGGVTCLCAPPPEYCRMLALDVGVPEKERFLLSGSTDCYVKIWALSTGQCVKSVYTFNVVTAFCFVPEGQGYIITGSDGGKVQAWSWQSSACCQSINAHEEAVTALQSQGPLVFSGSAEGTVCVWEVYLTDANPLHRLCQWGPLVTGCGGSKGSLGTSNSGRLALSPRGDRVFLACGRATIKVLNWRTGTVTRVTNHRSSAGVTDCVSQTSGILIGSCYDLVSGESTLNLFSLPQGKYVVSLSSPDIPRILCFTSWFTASGSHRWVTGGRELIVWEQLPPKTKQKGDVAVRRDRLFETCPTVESDEDSEEDCDDCCEEDYTPQDALDPAEVASSSWLRCTLQ
ncbi:F-box/WD repeat-containing protein 7 isoform X2 [Denticeps clupeoides]|uniref:F-box/WD repeat-containing protein 7 isoform X2 n=1 Tax=Denticeps clupeoides TaxID=299321 RepID=UPI0010A43A36|nr:F-box/WD repeat-containing protein 7-like isoform X2 [Denticeps clupeoides]